MNAIYFHIHHCQCSTCLIIHLLRIKIIKTVIHFLRGVLNLSKVLRKNLLVLNEATDSWVLSRCIFQRILIFLHRSLILWILKILKASFNLVFVIVKLRCTSLMNFGNKSLADSFQVLLNCLKMIRIKSILFIIGFCFF